MAKTPTWQRAEGKNPEGGLNEKGRASLRAAGHDIKRPQPEGGSRRDSFCARMKGMKSKLTSSETANDPDSRINKSLRKWNCADGGAIDPYDSVQQAAKGGPIWDKPRPKKLGKPEPLSSKEKASAKASAKAAGRPYPNLIDNMRAARADGGMTYPLAQRGNWTAAKHYEKMGGKLTHMSPEQFLSQTRPLKMDRKTRDDIDRIKNHISNGYHLNPLQLLANGLEDGRHRAYAAKELGVKSVPVVTFRADGGEVEGDVQFAPDDPYARVQEAAKLPMMAQHEYAMRMPEPEVRYDTGPQPGEATLKAYDPTIKERIYQGIAGTEERPSPERAQFARGMSQMAEFAPVLGNVMAGQEAQRRGDTKGMLMAALPVPGMATEARMAEVAAGPAQQAAQEAYQRVLNAQGLYSHAAEAAYNLPQAKGSYEQMMAMLQKAGVKPEEMRWSNVEQFAGQPVTREQLVGHFEQNVPKIEETVLGGPRDENLSKLFSVVPVGHGEFEVVNEAGRGITRYGSREMAEETAQRFNAEGLPSHLTGRGTIENPPKFEQYTIPGGENYREVLLHLPENEAPYYKDFESWFKDNFKSTNPTAQEYSRQYAMQQWEAANGKIPNYKGDNNYASSHWDQPNVLGHLRLSDRTGPQGEKILHMEELQSDWGQEGRKRGFKGDIKNIPEGYRIEKLDPAEAEKTGYSYTGYDPDGTRVLYGNSPEEVTHSLGNIVQGKSGSPPLPPAPYVEKTQNWVDLGLKRALKEAAEKGYDKLVWTPGAEQAARYDLSKQIKNLHYIKTNNGYLLGPETHTGQEAPINLGQPIPENKIADYVGKEVAEKIINGGESGVLSGLDLSVGGEGMKSFYDSIIPSRLKELMKKIDPQAKVELGGHSVGSEKYQVVASDGTIVGDYPNTALANAVSDNWPGTTVRKDPGIKAHSIQITPKMREAILKGLPAYAKGGEVVNDTDPYDNIRDASKNFPRARRASH